MTGEPDTVRTEVVAPLTDGRTETMVGASLVALVVLAAIAFRYHPGPIFLDHWGFSFIHPAIGNPLFKRVTHLRSVSFLVAGSILAALVVVARDRLRALACLIGPVLAVVAVEYLLKPVIARRYAQVLSFPSGTTTVVASVATAWVLAVPRRFRPVAVVIGVFLAGLECIAVTALQWHFPSDALGGVVFGAGVVVLLDGVLHLAWGARPAQDASPDGTDRVEPVVETDAAAGPDVSPP